MGLPQKHKFHRSPMATPWELGSLVEIRWKSHGSLMEVWSVDVPQKSHMEALREHHGASVVFP